MIAPVKFASLVFKEKFNGVKVDWLIKFIEYIGFVGLIEFIELIG